jgi:hypothetical protein
VNGLTFVFSGLVYAHVGIPSEDQGSIHPSHAGGSRLKSSTKLGTNQNGEKEEILKTAPNSAPRSDDARWLLALIAALS